MGTEELKDSEMGSDSDSEYSPDGDVFDYTKDYELEYDESVSASESTESEQSTDDEADYNPNYDLFDYSLDCEVYRESESDFSDTDSEGESAEEQDVESDESNVTASDHGGRKKVFYEYDVIY